jgi:hypothetical protein
MSATMDASRTESETLMKKFLLVLVGLGVLAAIVYLMGTEGGRARRDDLITRARKSSEDAATPEIDLREQASEVAESGADLAENAANKIGVPT